MGFATITLCVASQRVLIVIVVYFVIDSVRKLLVTHSYASIMRRKCLERNLGKTFPDFILAHAMY